MSKITKDVKFDLLNRAIVKDKIGLALMEITGKKQIDQDWANELLEEHGEEIQKKFKHNYPYIYNQFERGLSETIEIVLREALENGKKKD